MLKANFVKIVGRGKWHRLLSSSGDLVPSLVWISHCQSFPVYRERFLNALPNWDIYPITPSFRWSMDTVFHGPNRRRQESFLLKCPPSSSHPDYIPPYTPQCPEREVLTFFTNVVNHVKHLISPQWSKTVGTAWNNVEQVHPYLGRHFGLA